MANIVFGAFVIQTPQSFDLDLQERENFLFYQNYESDITTHLNGQLWPRNDW
jgi:hypothetical protein